MAETYTAGDEPVPGSGHRLVGFLGRGGFGEVWKATAPGGAEVAVKIINLGGTEGRKEFRALQLVKRIRHPNLVPVIAFWLKSADGAVLEDALATRPDVLTDTSPISAPLRATAAPVQFSGPLAAQLVIVMGLGDKSLFDRLEECRQEGLDGIPQQELLHYMEDAARAIDYLNNPIHDLGAGPAAIQHCDIKPHNIMIVGGATQVCDFGLARMMGADRTTTAAATMAYAAPECLETGKPSHSTDQYSLAVTYYELKTGRLPYSDETHVAVMNAKLEGTLDLSGVSGDEEVVLRRATASDPEKRYSTALDMVQRLRRAIEGEDIVGRPPRPGVLRRLVSTLMAVALVGLVAYHGWRYWRSQDHEVPNGGVAKVKEDPGQKKSTPPRVKDVPNKVPDKVDVLTARADAHREQGRFQEAVDDYTEALRIDPENGSAYFQRGRCYLRLAQFDKAIWDFGEAKERDAMQYGTHPEFAKAYLERGTQFAEDGEWPKAISDFTEAVAHDPRNGRLFSRRGTARFMLEDLEGALDDFDAAIAIDNDGSDYMRRGQVLQRLGRLDDAIADFEEAGRLDPQNALAHFRRGDCHLEKDDVEQAILALGEAIQIVTDTGDPSLPVADAYGVRGLCQMRAERFDKAADDFTQAIRHSQPDVASFHESRAICYEMLGHLEPARADRLIMSCLVRIDRDPNDHDAHNALAYFLATCLEPDVRSGEMAVKHATEACELTSWKEAEYIDTLASACAEAGQFDKAVEWAQKAIELAPDEEARDRFHAALELYRAGKPNHKSLPE